MREGENLAPLLSSSGKVLPPWGMVFHLHRRLTDNITYFYPSEVDVRNDTADLYRYFDCTEAAEFLYRCVEETIENDLPHEIDCLERHDKAMQQIMDTVEMPNRMVDSFIMFMLQNDWILPNKRRRDEFGKLTDSEVETLENIVREAFEGFQIA
jgi:hypothetical protein